MKTSPVYQNIKRCRIACDMTQTQLAKLMGYSEKSVISKIESGKIDLSLDRVEEFARVFGVSPGALCGWGLEIVQVVPPQDRAVLDAFHAADPVTQKNVKLLLDVD